MKGRKHSEETKRKIGLAMAVALKGRKPSENQLRGLAFGRLKGKKVSIETRRIKSELQKGRKHTEETRRKMSEATKGEKSFAWKGGLTIVHDQIRHSVDYKLWREAVFARDNYACVLCGDDKGGNLQADHIMPFAHYSELRFELSNGRTLCKECHLKTDTYGGGSHRYKRTYQELSTNTSHGNTNTTRPEQADVLGESPV